MPAGNNVWYTDRDRFGTITIQPTGTMKIKGETVKVPGLKLVLTVSWPGGMDPDDPTKHRPAGPEYIDLDDMLPGNLEACMNKIDPVAGDAWGENWKEKLIEWMEHPLRQKTFSFEKGDPRQQLKVRQSLTVERIEEINAALVAEGKEPLPGGYAPPKPAGTQNVTKGTRGRNP